MFAAVYDIGAASQQLCSASAFPADGQSCTFEGKHRVVLYCSAPETQDIDFHDHCGLSSLEGRFWIAGRIRLDDRSGLCARLSLSSSAVGDHSLCLHAYARWGERFVDFIAGDFSFVLWDNVRRCLIAVRDQLGCRPLFHAKSGNAWLISDSLDWIADRIPYRKALDDYWIADFLTMGFSREATRTIYRDAFRVEPSHSLKILDGRAVHCRYWGFPEVEPLRLHDRRAYGEQFRAILSSAIADRLPAGPVGIFMSGGLDSTALAACTASTVTVKSKVVAYCAQYDSAPQIREGHYASLAAGHVGIGLRLVSADGLAYDQKWRERGISWSEPTRAIICAEHTRQTNDDCADAAAVWFEGEGPDNALQFERRTYFSLLRARRDWGRFGAALLQYAWVKGGAGWAQTWRRYTRQRPVSPSFSLPPSWLDSDFSHRLRLVQRDRDLGDGGQMSGGWRPAAVASLTSPVWQSFFDDFDFQESLSSVVWRHPFLDLRMLKFMLSVPAVPWTWKKRLVRDAMSGLLPKEVLSREKAPLPVYPSVLAIKRCGLPPIENTAQVSRYVDLGRIPSIGSEDFELYRSISLHVVDHWLSTRRH